MKYLLAPMALAAIVFAPSIQGLDLPFETTSVVQESAPLEQYFDGTVEAVNQATVSAQTAGRVSDVLFDVDDYVEAGSVIVRFTDADQQSSLRRAKSGLQEAQARALEAENEFRRAKGLYDAGSGSEREYNMALAGRDSANARVLSAQSQVETAQQQVEYTVVRAPYPGIVTRRSVEVGEAVNVGQPLMSGLSLDSLRVVVDLPQKVASEVRKLRKARVLAGEASLEPEQITVFPFADPATNTFQVRLDLPEGQFGLYPGMYVKTAFVVGEADRLLIPAIAVLRRSEVTAVYVIDSESNVRLRQVRLGNLFDDRIEILAGLVPGEQIATDPVAAGIYLKSPRVGDDDG